VKSHSFVELDQTRTIQDQDGAYRSARVRGEGEKREREKRGEGWEKRRSEVKKKALMMASHRSSYT